MNAGNFLSPEAMWAIPLSIVLDGICFVLFFFSLDDFFTTDIIGFATLGVWASFRSQVRGSSEIQTPDQEERREGMKDIKEQFQQNRQKEAQTSGTTRTSKVTKTSKYSRWVRWLRFVKFVPWLGGIIPGWTISTFLILKED